MSDLIEGVVEQCNCTEGKKHPKYGQSYKIGIKVDGEWYNGFLNKKTLDDYGIDEGAEVRFEVYENDRGYVNIDAKSLKVLEKAASKPARSSSGQAASSGKGAVHGATVGMAINNAVYAVSHGVIDKSEIPEFCSRLIKLSAALEAGKDFTKSTPDDQAVEDEEEPEEKPKPKRKAPAKKPKEEAPADDDFSDDIPF